MQSVLHQLTITIAVSSVLLRQLMIELKMRTEGEQSPHLPVDFEHRSKDPWGTVASFSFHNPGSFARAELCGRVLTCRADK